MTDDGERPDAVGPRPVLLLITPDLFLASRIKGHAEAAGFRVRSGVSLRALDAFGDEAPDRIVVDLGARGLDPTAICSRIGSDAADRVAAYAAHVRSDLLRAARAAGLTAVFTKGQLETELPRWLAPAR